MSRLDGRAKVRLSAAFRRSRMKPAAFDYVVPETIEAAVQALAAANGDGKVMAGGQSLMPLLNFRMTRPSVVVDLMRIPGLSSIELRDGHRRDRRPDAACGP